MKTTLVALFIGLMGVSTFAQIDRSTPPKPQPNPEINIDIPDVITTENGMKLIVVENHKLPVVSFQLYVDYPTFREGDKAGTGQIFGEMLGSGTESNDKDAFDAKIDYMGADFFPSSRGFYASSLKKHTPKLLELLSEVVMKPSFPQDEFDRIVKQNVSALATAKSDPGTMAGNVASIVNYGADHPYGEIVTEETLGNITLEDIKKMYSTYFVAGKAYLVIVGDVTQEEAKGYADKYFSGWKQGGEMKQEKFDVPSYEGNNVYFVDKPGAVQSMIRVTHTVDYTPGHPDALKIRIMNQILGGGSFSAHLMQNLREDKAYTYGCYSQMNSDQLIGSFSAGGSFRNEVTDSAVVQILHEINWMTENPVADKELSLVKASITGAFARSLEQPRTLANFALNTARYNLPKDYYTTYLTRLEKITKEEILETAKKYLQPENLSIVIVGNSDEAEKQSVFDTKDGMEFRDSYGNEAVQMKKADISLDELMQKYAFNRLSVSSKEDYDAAAGKIGMIITTYGAEIEAMNASFTMTSWDGAPNKSASIVKIKSPQGAMTAQKEWFNGESGGTFVMMQGKTKYEGDELEAKKQPSFPIGQMYYSSNPFITAELLGIDEYEGKEYYKVKLTEQGQEGFAFEYYDMDGWLAMREQFEKDAEGNMVSGMIIYGAYEEVKKGYMLPSSMTMINPGQPPMEMKLIKATIKGKAKAKAFEGEF